MRREWLNPPSTGPDPQERKRHVRWYKNIAKAVLGICIALWIIIASTFIVMTMMALWQINLALALLLFLFVTTIISIYAALDFG